MNVVSKLNLKSDHHRTWTFEVLVMKIEVFSEGFYQIWPAHTFTRHYLVILSVLEMGVLIHHHQRITEKNVVYRYLSEPALKMPGKFMFKERLDNLVTSPKNVSMQTIDHEYWMRIALAEARTAITEDEIPVGAVLVRGDDMVISDHNRTRQLQNPLAHAEKLIIDKIMQEKIKYLQDFTLYVTLEPCLMCAGTLIWSRLGCLVMGARDPKAGAVGSVYNVLSDKSFNHNPQIVRGVLEQECGSLLKSFFQSKRT